jgi:hypothetical protein
MAQLCSAGGLRFRSTDIADYGSNSNQQQNGVRERALSTTLADENLSKNLTVWQGSPSLKDLEGRIYANPHERIPQALRQVLWLPDERLRFASYGGYFGARRICRNDRSERGRPSHPQRVPHPREGGGEGLFRTGPYPPAETTRRARGDGTCWSPSPAASPRPKERKSSALLRWSISYSARKTIIACPPSSPAPRTAAK